MSPAEQPLAGIRVVDFTQVMLGPSATQLLADHGAEVIKVERPGTGELMRDFPGADPDDDNAIFLSLNRSKRAIALDFSNEEGRRVVTRLVERADVLVHNFRPGVMERRGFGYEDVRALNERLVYAVGSGFGPTGPLARKRGQDNVAQAMSGVMMRKAEPDQPTLLYATALADYTAGLHLALGIMLALQARARTGRGQRVDASLYSSMLALQMQEATTWLMDGSEMNWVQTPMTGVFETADGAVVLVGAFLANPLREICLALDAPDLSEQPPFDTFEGLDANRAELHARLAPAFARHATADCVARLEARDVLVGPVRSLPEALDEPQTRHNGMLIEIPRAGRPAVRTVASPIALGDAPQREPTAPPRLGEHTDEILADLGYDAAEVAALRDGGVVA